MLHLTGRSTGGREASFVSFHEYSARLRSAWSLGGYHMMMLKISILIAIVFTGCSVPTNPNVQQPVSHAAQQPVSDLKEVKHGGVSFVYSTVDFAEVEIEKQQKQTAQDVGDGVPVGIAPEHFCF